MKNYFSEDYSSAREAFLNTCSSKGFATEPFFHPQQNDRLEPLATDVTYVGPENASKILVMISGVHGVETFCGSGCQSGWLQEQRYESLPGDTGVLMIHALNCWGAAHLRRNTDGNVDLCRNFMDFTQPLPENPLYEEVHEWLSCPEYKGELRDTCVRALRSFADQRGQPVFLNALMGGQYHHSKGFAFGGSQKTWSNETVCQILEKYCLNAKQVVTVEYHSGLGPYGYGSAVTMHSGKDLERCKTWFGNWVLAPNEDSSSGDFHQTKGHTTEGYVSTLNKAQVTSIVLEFGTYSPQRNLQSLLDDHWLICHGDPNSKLGKQIKDELLETHHPKDPHWRQAVWDRSNQVITQALDGLTRDDNYGNTNA